MSTAQQEKVVRFRDWNLEKSSESNYSEIKIAHSGIFRTTLSSVSEKFQNGLESGSDRIKSFRTSFKSFPYSSALSRSFSSRKKILDPQGPFLQRWNKIFVLLCVIAVSLDPLFFYVPVIDDEKKCLSLDSKMEITATVLRSFSDAFYIIHMIFQFRTGFIAPSSRVFGRGVLVEDSWAIARRYLSSYFLVDILAVLPLPQVVILVIIPKMSGFKSLNTKNLLKFVVFFQYVPRLLRVIPLYREVTRASGILTETAWAGAAFNLFLYMLASHVVGAFWYLFSIERETTCWQEACRSNTTVCNKADMYCNDYWGGLSKISTFLNTSCPIQKEDKNLFDFGMFLDALQSGVVESRDFPQKFFYCFWWGLKNLSSLGQNLGTSTYVWEICFAVFISVSGLVLFSFLIGNMQTYLQSTTTRLEEMRVKRRDAEQWMSHRLLPDGLRVRIRHMPPTTPPPPPTMAPSPQEIIFRSPLPDIPIPTHLPLHSYCFQNLSQFQHRTCLIDGETGETLTYAEVDLAARRIAAGLHNIGIRQGDVIMLVLRNCPQFALAFLGASHRGAVITTANPFYTPLELAKQAAATKTRLVITQSAYVDKIKSFADNNDVMVMCIDSEDDGVLHFSTLTNADETEAPAVKISPDDVVALPFSSGTSGLPKGVMLSHKNLVTTIAQLVDGENAHQYTHSEDVLLCVLPMFHIYALNSILLSGIRSGAAVLIVQKFEMTSLLELIQKYRVTVASFVPPIVLALVKSGEAHRYDLSSVRAVVTGAAPLGKELQEAVESRLPHATFGQGYGMTEAGPLAISMAFAKEPSNIKPGACGTVVRNAEMKIVDTETGVSLPKNETGEICIRGTKVMKGYLNDPEATERTIDKDGWLHTGDIGYIDDDDELFIVDRLKELIKYKGFQVAPAELEALLIAHPNISEAAVVPMKDEAAGEIPVAFVVRSKGSEITEDEIKQYISQQVVFYKRIGRVFFTDSIPKAASGKILRKVLTARLNEGLVVAN